MSDSSDDDSHYIAIWPVWAILVARSRVDRDPLSRAERALSAIRQEIAAHSLASYEQAHSEVRRQMETALLDYMDRLSRIALGVRRHLNAEIIERRTRARTTLPQVVDALLEARAKYRAFAGTEAPGAETLNALKTLVADATDPAGPAPAA